MSVQRQSRGGWVRGPDGRPWPVIRVGLYLLAYALANVVVAAPLLLTIGALAPGAVEAAAGDFLSPLGLIVVATTTAATVLATWAFSRVVDRRSWLDLGARRERGWVGELLGGMGVGAALMTGVLLAEVALGGYRIEGVTFNARTVAALLMGLVLHALVSFGEELLARGYVLRTLAEQWGRRGAIVASSLVFALLHSGNPGSDALAQVGVFCAGVMLGVAYVRTDRLWLPIGVHWTWNLFQGPVYGFAVSGTEAAGLLTLVPVGPPLLTGGAFGPEASLVGIAACLLGAAALARWPRWSHGPAAQVAETPHQVEDPMGRA